MSQYHIGRRRWIVNRGGTQILNEIGRRRWIVNRGGTQILNEIYAAHDMIGNGRKRALRVISSEAVTGTVPKGSQIGNQVIT